jgi:hypothetical protein
MNIDSDLRDYIDGIVDPIAMSEVTRLHEPSVVTVHTTRRRAIAIGAVVALICVGSGFLLLRHLSREPGAHEVSRAPTALTATGPADCTAFQSARIILPVTLSNGHAICVTDDDTTTTVYLDGKRGLTFTGGSLNTRAFGVIGRAGQSFVIGGDIGLNAQGLRVTFCDGKRIDLPNVNHGDPAFVFAQVPITRSGAANWKYSQPLDAKGAPLEPRGGPGPAACGSTKR